MRKMMVFAYREIWWC